MTVGERTKELRKDTLGLSQVEFATRLGMTRDAISNFEMDRLKRDSAKEPTIKAIVREFGVREAWLRTGDGPMYADNQEAARITSWAADTLADGDPFKLRLLGVMSRLTPEQWDSLKALAEHLVNGGE